MTIWDSPDALDALKKVREQHKGLNPHLTFDCVNAHVRGERVICTKGHKLSNRSRDGAMTLLMVLRGMTSSACKKCPDFEGD